jgi:hypothetical protein
MSRTIRLQSARLAADGLLVTALAWSLSIGHAVPEATTPFRSAAPDAASLG